MSRMRIEAKVRKNPDFVAMTTYLDSLGLEWSVQNPTGKGHPKLVILLPSGSTYAHTMACTPRLNSPPAGKVAQLKRALLPLLGA